MQRASWLSRLSLSVLLWMALQGPGWAQSVPAATVQAKAQEQVQPLLGTLKDLVSIESGSRDLEGLSRLAELVAARLQAAGMTV
jgi:glutamate carboxypeptidase